MRRVTVCPVTRVEGRAQVELFLDEHGEVAEAYFVVPELRGFERLCLGRPVEEMPALTSRICGLCPEAHRCRPAPGGPSHPRARVYGLRHRQSRGALLRPGGP